MPAFTFLVLAEVVVGAPDPGEAADDLNEALRNLKWLRSSGDRDAPVIVDYEVRNRWWRASPVEIDELRRATRKSRRES